MSEEFFDTYKIVLVGNSFTGKSNYCNVLCGKEFDPQSKPTIGFEFSSKVYNFDGKAINAQIWVSPNENYRVMISAFYRGALGILLFYDITNPESFDSLPKWIEEINENVTEEEATIMLVGAKIDSKENRKISYEKGQAFANSHHYLFEEVSAHDSKNINESFTALFSEIYKKQSTPENEAKRQMAIQKRKEQIMLEEKKKQEEQKNDDENYVVDMPTGIKIPKFKKESSSKKDTNDDEIKDDDKNESD